MNSTIQSEKAKTKRAMCHKHIEDALVTAEFSKDRKYRYRLVIEKRNAPSNGKTACVIMMNPSYACETFADKSVQFMEKIVFLKNLPEFKDVQRLIVVNQFALIQTHHFQGLPHEIGPKNNSAIERAFNEAHIIIVGWGCANPFETRKKWVLDKLSTLKGKLLLQTRTHPSRARYEGFITPLSLRIN